MKTISRLVSSLFHPLLFPLYGTFLVLVLNPNRFGYFGERIHFAWLFMVFILTVIFPLVWILMMKGLGMIDSLNMDTPKERIIPFVAACTFYLWTTWMFKANVHLRLPTNQFIFYMMLGACLSVFIAFFLNIWMRVSLHTLGAGSILGLLLVMVKFSTFDIRSLIVGGIIIAGLIGTASLILKKHSDGEVIAGYFIGFTGQFLAFSVISRFL